MFLCSVSFPHSITLLPANLTSLTAIPPSSPACLPPPPRRAAPLSPCNICLSFGMKRKCLPVGSQVAHPEGWLRLMPVIQLCWFTPRTHKGVGDYTVLCWRGRKRQTDKTRQREGERVKEREDGRDGCHVVDDAPWVRHKHSILLSQTTPFITSQSNRSARSLCDDRRLL